MIPTKKPNTLRMSRTFFTLILLVGILLFTPTVKAVVNTDDIAYYYSFDDTNLSGSTVYDLSSNNEDGTNNGATTGVNSLLNEAFYYDGDTGADYVDTTNTSVGGRSVSVSGWINGTDWKTGGAWNTIISNGATSNPFAGYSILIDNDGNINFFTGDGSSTSSAEWTTGLNNNQWYHFVLTWTGTTATNGAKLYLDNVSQGSKTMSKAWSGNSYMASRIGCFVYSSACGSSSYWTGQIEELGVWDNHILNTSEITDLYNSGTPLSYYDFAGGSPPATPNASDHKTETTTLQQQTTNVTLNSVTYSTVYSYTFAPINDTVVQQDFAIHVDPTASNTLDCQIPQPTGVGLIAQGSRTNTAGQKGTLFLTGVTGTLTGGTNYTIDLECKRIGGGSMVIHDTVGIGHLLFDQASGKKLNWTANALGGSTTTPDTFEEIDVHSFTTSTDNLTEIERHLVFDYATTITNNDASDDIVYIIPTVGGQNCTTLTRQIPAGGSGSIGGTCIAKNLTMNTSYDYGFFISASNIALDGSASIKELHLHDDDITKTIVNLTSLSASIISRGTASVQQDLGAGQDIFSSFTFTHTGTGTTNTFYLNETSTNDYSPEYYLNSGTNERISGVKYVYRNLATGNYTSAIFANSFSTFTGDLIGYVTGKQLITIEEQGLNLKNFVDNTTITSFTATLGNGNSYSTTTGSITIPEQGLQNITYSATGYVDKTYTNVNTSQAHTGYPCQVELTSTATDLQGTSITYPYNLTANSITQLIDSATATACINSATATNITFSKTGYWNYTTEHTYTQGTHNHAVTNISNAWLKFYGATSGTEYTPSCEMNGTTVVRRDTNYYAVVDGAQFQCIEGTYYLPFNQTINTSSYPVNASYAITEYTVTLNFSANVNGTIAWTGTTDGQYDLANDSGYNITEAKWVKLASNFTDEDYVQVVFNEQANNTAQYYEWISDTDSIINENINVLTTLDMFLRFKVFNLAKEELYGATVRLEHCPDGNLNNCKVVNQRITQPLSGTAHDGTAFSIDDDLIYWATISAEGYETKSLLFNAQDLDNQFIFEVHLNTLPFNYEDNYQILCPESHVNYTTIVCTISGESGTIAWGTDVNGQQTPITLQTGGTSITLTAGTDYNNASNVTVSIYEPDGNGGWTSLASKSIPYLAIPRATLYIDESTATSTSTAILWVILILIASVVGFSIRKDEIDTGYYVFAGGILIISIFYPTLMIVSAIIVLTGVGNLLFASTRE